MYRPILALPIAALAAWSPHLSAIADVTIEEQTTIHAFIVKAHATTINQVSGGKQRKCEMSTPVLAVTKTQDSATLIGHTAQRTNVAMTQSCKIKDSADVCQFSYSLDVWLTQDELAGLADRKTFQADYQRKLGLSGAPSAGAAQLSPLFSHSRPPSASPQAARIAASFPAAARPAAHRPTRSATAICAAPVARRVKPDRIRRLMLPGGVPPRRCNTPAATASAATWQDRPPAHSRRI
jgi:hypothetical protein